MNRPIFARPYCLLACLSASHAWHGMVCMRMERGEQRSIMGPVHSPSLNSDKLTDNKDIKRWVENYLGVGEWIMDQSVAVLGSSPWFERRR